MNTYEKINQLLKDNNISYKEFRHEPVRTSEEAAKVRGDISITQGAKALIVKYKNKDKVYEFAMVIVPGDQRFDSKKVRGILGINKLSFATADEVFQITNGVIPGGVPPFGNLFGIKMIAEKTLLNNDEIAFNAGDRSISILMNSKNWLILCNPQIEDVI